MSRPLDAIEADIKAARADLARLLREKRRAMRPPNWQECRREAFRQRALASVRALPAMTAEQRRFYYKLRYRIGFDRAGALKAVGVAA